MEYTVKLERFGEEEGSYSHASAVFSSEAQWKDFKEWISMNFRADPMLVSEFWRHQLASQERLSILDGYTGIDRLLEEYKTRYQSPSWILMKGTSRSPDMLSSYVPMWHGYPRISYEAYKVGKLVPV